MKMLYVKRFCTLVVASLLISSNMFANEINGTTKTAPAASIISVKSYREWKTAMVDAAELRVQKIKNNLEQQRQVSGTNLDPNLKNQLSKEQLQAALASELTINDYFVGYLNKQANLQHAIKGVAGKLNDEEVAELMSAYAYSFNKNEMKPLQSASESGSQGTLD
jgi:hypothetical protein